MLRQNRTKQEFLKLREARSKSFGCEKELHSKKKTKKMTSCKTAPKSDSKQDKKHFNIEENLNYIDDEISQINENDNLSDDYDDNVIYEGESADELNDYDSFSSELSDSEGTDLIKCRSAPISPTCQPQDKQHDSDTRAYFIYDVNLYNDQHNLLILNSQDEFKKKLKKKIDNSSSTESCSSIGSAIHFEPLVINEENSAQLSCTNSSNKITVVDLNKEQNHLLCSRSSSSTSEHKDSSMCDSIKNVNLDADECANRMSTSDSLESTSSKTESKSEDSTSLTDEQSSSSSNFSTDSQYCLKDSYEKAKRERQIEQQLAEMEQKRLQEILDICIEFQNQEHTKHNSPTDSNQKTNSDNHSPKQNSAVVISQLPSLDKVLSANKTNSQSSLNLSSQANSNKEVNIFVSIKFLSWFKVYFKI